VTALQFKTGSKMFSASKLLGAHLLQSFQTEGLKHGVIQKAVVIAVKSKMSCAMFSRFRETGLPLLRSGQMEVL